MPSSTLRSAGHQSVPSQGHFVRVPLAAFRLQEIVDVDLYSQGPEQTQPSFYRSASYPITEEDLHNLERRGHTALYISANDSATVEKQLFESLDAIVADESVAPEERFAVLQSAVAVEVNVAFRLIKCSRFVSLADRLGQHIATLLDESKILAGRLYHLVQHDYFTFTHVTNVAGFSVLLADQLGMAESEELRTIAAGALLHDIGKRFIPAHVLCKPGKLTDRERQLIETHPQRGYEDLLDREDVQFGQLMMVYQHHERLDGSGYPVAVLQDEIHPWAQLLAVVDIFDALTSRRPYRKQMRLEDALSYLEHRAGTQLDAEIVRCWLTAVRQS